jgi:hypothetical protein
MQLNSEYNSRYKTFAVHRPVTTKAKILSHPTDSAPEAMESSRRAGLLSNQFTNVSEPALQRKRIVPYKNNHNILSTSTVKELNDRDWLEAVGNGGDEEISAGSVKRKVQILFILLSLLVNCFIVINLSFAIYCFVFRIQRRRRTLNIIPVLQN